MDENNGALHVIIGQELKNDLKIQAIKEGKTIKILITELIENYLRKKLVDK